MRREERLCLLISLGKVRFLAVYDLTGLDWGPFQVAESARKWLLNRVFLGWCIEYDGRCPPPFNMDNCCAFRS